MTPIVSVVVVTHQSEETIAPCLSSIREESRRVPLEAIVVDSASTDATCRNARRELPQARLVSMTRNRGFAAACNAGARGAAGEYLLLLNPDTVLLPRAIPELVEALARTPSGGAAGPRIVRPDGQVELSWGSRPGLASEASRKLLGWIHDRRRWPFERWIDRSSRRPREPFWVSGACLLMPTALYHEVGGMDEEYFLYFEDVDLCTRLRSRDRQVIYWPHAEVMHRGGVSARTNRQRVAIEYRRSQLRYYRLHHAPEVVAALRLYLACRFLLGEALAWAAGRREDARLARDLLALVREGNDHLS